MVTVRTSLIPMNARIFDLYEHLRKMESEKFNPTDIEIDVITRASLSTEMLSPTEKYSTFHKTPKYIKPGVLTLMDSVPLLFLTTQPQVGYHVSSFSRSEIHSSLTFCSIFSKLNHEYDPSHHRHVV
jgi:hypothetical protein